MTGRRFAVATAACTLFLLAPSCRLFRKSTKAAPPPAPAPTQPAQRPPSAARQPAALPAPPEISPQDPDLSQQPPAPSSGKLPPPPRRRGRPRTSESAGTAQPPAQPPAEDTTAAAPEAEAPQLEQILSPEERQAYLEDIDSNINRAQKTVDTLQGRNLSGEQKTYLARVRAFMDQAREARKTDLFRAKNLAERASVLAEDLMRSAQ
jgi:hypothetical protein